MTTQAAVANTNGNSFGDGAKISINVSTNSKKKMPNEEKESSQAITLQFQNSEEDKTLTKWLSAIHLDHIYNKLKELGVEEIEDTTLLDEEDLNSLDLKKIQMKKLKRAIANIK